MLALTALSASAQALCWGIAMILFIIATFIPYAGTTGPWHGRANFVAAGLAFGSFVFFYQALAAT